MDAWKLKDQTGELINKAVSGKVDLGDPDSGITSLKYNETAVASKLFAINDFPDSVLVDSYQRDSDLVAAYGQSRDLPFSYHIYWRSIEPEVSGVLFESEFVLSLETSLLGISPSVEVYSEILGSLSRFENKDLENVALVKTNSADFSAVMGLHATDWNSLDQNMMTQEEGHAKVGYKLGVAHLEKGVIRRMRFRFALISNEALDESTLKWNDLFTNSPPPLTV